MVLGRLEQEQDGCSLLVRAVDLLPGASGRPLAVIHGVGHGGGAHFNTFWVTGGGGGGAGREGGREGVEGLYESEGGGRVGGGTRGGRR